MHVHGDAACGHDVVLMKGAQERVLERCTHAVIDGNVVALTPKERADVMRRQEALSATGCAALASPSSSSILARTALTP